MASASASEDDKETRIGYLGWSAVSLAGGVMLIWWEWCFHATNRQQWMVPLGLILFVTPILVCFSIFISDFLSSPYHM